MFVIKKNSLPGVSVGGVGCIAKADKSERSVVSLTKPGTCCDVASVRRRKPKYPVRAYTSPVLPVTKRALKCSTHSLSSPYIEK